MHEIQSKAFLSDFIEVDIVMSLTTRRPSTLRVMPMFLPSNALLSHHFRPRFSQSSCEACLCLDSDFGGFHGTESDISEEFSTGTSSQIQRGAP